MDAHCLASASPGHAVVGRPGTAEERRKIPAVTAATGIVPRDGRGDAWNGSLGASPLNCKLNKKNRSRSLAQGGPPHGGGGGQLAEGEGRG